jgi:uncharacterized protein YceK
MKRFLPILCVLPLVAGCGSLANMDGREFALMGPRVDDPKPFGGAGNDIRWVREQVRGAVSADELSVVPLHISLAGYFGLVDLPMSLVGDTFTLPKIISDIGKSSTENDSPPNLTGAATTASEGLRSGSMVDFGGERADSETIESLIAQLRSKNKDPNPKGKYLGQLPDSFDWRVQKQVDIAFQKLGEFGKRAFPILLNHLNDKEYSGPISEFGDCPNGSLSLSVGDVCCRIIKTQVDQAESGYKSRLGRDGQSHCHKGYFSQFFKNEGDTPQVAYRRWWKEHRDQSLKQMQAEALRWAIAQERSIGFPEEKDEERYLEPLLTRLRELNGE